MIRFWQTAFPQGIWQGPIVSVLGLILMVIGGRQLLRAGSHLTTDLSGSTELADEDTKTASDEIDLLGDETETCD